MGVFEKCTHECLEKKSLFSIKHLTPEKRDTPLFFFFLLIIHFLFFCCYFFCKNNEFDDLQGNKWLKMWQCSFISCRSFFATPFIHMRWDAWYGLKNYVHATMDNDNNWMQCKFVPKSHLLTCMPMWLKSTMHDMQLIEKNYMRCNACARVVA